jgi:hypothetical protein
MLSCLGRRKKTAVARREFRQGEVMKGKSHSVNAFKTLWPHNLRGELKADKIFLFGFVVTH